MPDEKPVIGALKSGMRQVSHLVLLGHPSGNSFNSALAQRYVDTVQANHHDAVLRDLYALDFDPRLKEEERLPKAGVAQSPDVEAELRLIEQCDVITFVYPLWFGMPPAIIKGYIDRVFGAGFRAEHLQSAGGNLLRGKRLAIISTSASTLPWLESQGMWIALRQSFETYMKAIFDFSVSYHYHAASIVDGLQPLDAERIFFEVEEFARNICADTAISLRGRGP